jgi:hypothetical protein
MANGIETLGTIRTQLQYDCPVATVARRPEAGAMKLRIVSTVLWFLAGWNVAGAIAVILGLNHAIGPLAGIASAAFVGIDPKHLVWRVGTGSAKAAQAPDPHGAAVGASLRG